MKLFTVGPTQMRKEILDVRHQQVPYFRTTEFSDVMLDSDRLLKKFMNAPESYKSIYLTASGTGALEATIMNCMNETDHVLVINGGTFGQRFVDLCELHEIPHTMIKLEDGEALTANHFAAVEEQAFTFVIANIDETSTAQLYDINLLSCFAKKKQAYLVIDAISSFLIDHYDMAGNNIDVTILSSQKGLCIAPGISPIVISDRLYEERVKNNHIKNLYFDFNQYVKNFTRGQTPFTPAVGVCLEMNKALHLIEEEGFENYLARIDSVAKDFRNRIKELPVSIPTFTISNAVTPIRFEQPIAKDVFTILKDKYDIFVISDEIYGDITYNYKHTSLAEFIPEQTVLISGLSKSHAMTGWRVGFIAAPLAMIRKIGVFHLFTVSGAATFIQDAAVVALNDENVDKYNRHMIETYRERKDYMVPKLRELGFEIPEIDGAFYIFAKIPAKYRDLGAMEFCKILAKEARVGVIPGTAFGSAYNDFFRISYATSIENIKEAVERISQFMNK